MVFFRPVSKYPVLKVSALVAYDLPEIKIKAYFTTMVADAIHSHFPKEETRPEDSLLEHAPYVTRNGYVRVGITIKNPAVVESLIAATSSTGLLHLPPRIPGGGIHFPDARVSWENV
jgi:hypothetical protein